MRCDSRTFTDTAGFVIDITVEEDKITLLLLPPSSAFLAVFGVLTKPIFRLGGSHISGDLSLLPARSDYVISLALVNKGPAYSLYGVRSLLGTSFITRLRQYVPSNLRPKRSNIGIAIVVTHCSTI
jgi:hypothetical protein